MSRGSYPLLLTMALSAPGAAQALGLGEIHIDSKLNQPLSAHIDIIGANEAEIAGLHAAVANREVFQRFGSDRPAFLSTAQFKVSRDAQGRPVLSVRSSEAFTEPVVNLLIELNWPSGRLVREYTLLLDPEGFGGGDVAMDAALTPNPPVTTVAATTAATPSMPPAPVNPVAPAEATAPRPAHGEARPAAAPAAAQSTTPMAEPQVQGLPAPSDQETPPAATDTHTVRGNETLNGIARQWGMRSAGDVRRMMIATFRANPDAFEGNINRLRLGAVLRIPAAAELAALSAYEVNRDYRVQMSQWRLEGRPAATTQISPPSVAAPTQPLPDADDPRVPAPAAAQAAAAQEQPVQPAANPAASESNADIVQQIQKLESAIADMNEQLARRDAQLRDLREQADAAAADAARAAAAQEEERAAAASAHHNEVIAKRTAAAVGTAGSIAALFALLRMRRPKPGKQAPAQASAAPPDEGKSAASDDAADAPALAAAAPQTAPAMAPATAVVAAPATTSMAAPVLKSTPRPAAAAKPDPADEETIILDTTGDTTKNMAMDPTLTMAHEEIMADLENTAHHVDMPSDLNSPAQSGPFVERRKSVIDVLRAAIEREPHRRELKMKLLELYYAAAASNQAAFLEVAKALARDRDVLASGDWDRIVAMGRSITPNERLFLPDAQSEAVPEVTDSAA